MHAARDSVAMAIEAENYRQQAREFSLAAQRARSVNDESTALSHERTAADYRVLAAGVERELRGLPPLPPVGIDRCGQVDPERLDP